MKMAIEDAKRIIRDCREEISFMSTQPYGYLDVEILSKRIVELENFILANTPPTDMRFPLIDDSGVESFA